MVKCPAVRQLCHLKAATLILASAQFRDGLALHYLLHPSNLPAKCDDCGADFALHHAFASRKGGQIEICNCIGDQMKQV